MAGAGNAIRGSRVGAGPMGEAERGESAPRRRIPFWCANGHETRPAFAEEAAVPDTWDCPRCGLPAGTDEQNPPPAPRTSTLSGGRPTMSKVAEAMPIPASSKASCTLGTGKSEGMLGMPSSARVIRSRIAARTPP